MRWGFGMYAFAQTLIFNTAVMDNKQCFWYNSFIDDSLGFPVASNACKSIYPSLILNKKFRF